MVKNVLIILICLAVIFFVASAIFVYFFVIPPRVVSLSPADYASGISLSSPLVIKFDKPVDRNKITHDAAPEIYGEWRFEDPVIKNHLFRTLVFVPAVDFKQDTRYYIKIGNIGVPLGTGSVRSFSFSFKTQPPIQLAQFSDLVTMLRKIDLVDFWIKAFGEPAQKTSLVVEKSSTIKTKIISGEAATINKNTTKLTIIKTPLDWQDYPLSCEAASLKMALAVKGVSVSEDDIMQKIGYDTTAHSGGVWGDPYSAFVGNISGSMCSTGYGVYWEPVAKAASYWRPAEHFSGWSIKQLTDEIKIGNPVIFWGVLPTGVLTDCSWYTPAGEYVRAFKQDHVRLVVGFIGDSENPSKVIIKDPLSGDLYWSTEKFLTNWGIYGNSGVVVY